MKKYLLTTEIPPIQIPQKEHTEEEILKYLYDMKQYGIPPIDSNPPPLLPNYLQQEISEETFRVLDNICNIEINKYGDKEYVCNKIRMKIEEIV